MKKTLAAISAAAVIAAGTFSMPAPAQAHAWWVVPTIVGGVLVGSVAIASATNPYYRPYAYAGPGGIYVEPTCRVVRERTAEGWRRVRICQ